MKNLIEIIKEKLKINSKSNVHQYKYIPDNKEELIKIINECINENGLEANLNNIDTSNINDMSYLFSLFDENGRPKRHMCFNEFNGDISGWNVSNVTDMSNMFRYSKFNGDISKWNVSNVTNMNQMFSRSKFNRRNISKWNVNKVKDMEDMFWNCPLEKNPPKWYKV